VCSNSVAAITFVEAQGGYINPSRFDPGRITSQAILADRSRYALMVDGKVATCVSSMMSVQSFLRQGLAFGRARPVKTVAGLLHDQEYERFVAFICLASACAHCTRSYRMGPLFSRRNQLRLGQVGLCSCLCYCVPLTKAAEALIKRYIIVVLYRHREDASSTPALRRRHWSFRTMVSVCAS
jgi:hypothetical protein